MRRVASGLLMLMFLVLGGCDPNGDQAGQATGETDQATGEAGHDHHGDPDALDAAVESLIDWAGPAGPDDPDNTITVNAALDALVPAIVKMQANCAYLRGLQGTYPELSGLDCDFGGPGGGDEAPSGKPPDWP